jgi:hypothetical protein
MLYSFTPSCYTATVPRFVSGYSYHFAFTVVRVLFVVILYPHYMIMRSVGPPLSLLRLMTLHCNTIGRLCY